MGYARVFGNANISDKGAAFGKARVFGNAHVRGSARVFGNPWVFNDARVYGVLTSAATPAWATTQ